MYFALCFWHIPQTRGIMPMTVLKYHVQKLMHVAIDEESRYKRGFECTKCNHKNHADLNAPENHFHRAVSGAVGNIVCKQKDAMGRLALKVKSFQKETINPERFQFGTRCHAGYYCGVLKRYLPYIVPRLLEKHKDCTKNWCVYLCI